MAHAVARKIADRCQGGRAGQCTACNRPKRNQTIGTCRKKILRRRPGWPLDRFSTVERNWDGGTVICIGGGTSLTATQVAQAVASGHRIIGVNDAYRICPSADVCYFADSEWWNWHKNKPDFIAFDGEKCSIQNSGANIDDGNVHLLRNRNFPNNGYGVSLEPEYLVTGGNSGYQAVNLAVLAGARTIILIGYDGREPEKGKPSHWFGNHPRIESPGVFAKYRESFKKGAAGIEAAGVRVINCSPSSAIDAFEKMELAEALRCVAPIT